MSSKPVLHSPPTTRTEQDYLGAVNLPGEALYGINTARGVDNLTVSSRPIRSEPAFVRVLLNRPRIAFLDEATSATDEGLEHVLYSLLRRELPQCMLVSVDHRSTLHAFHSHRLELQGEGRWTLSALG